MTANRRFLINTIFIVFVLATFIACEGDNIDDTEVTPVYDCPALEVNIGDDCVYVVDVDGQLITISSTINDNCECAEIEFDCPALQLNIGDDCNLPNMPNTVGIVNDNCECEEEATTSYDCPAIQSNIGDYCEFFNDPNAIGIVNENCECIELEVDCPNLQLNIGDDCEYTAMTPNGLVTFISIVDDNCECAEIEFECPDLFLNIGDICTTTDGNTGNVTQDCECL